MTMASCRSASSQIAGRSATIPSMEKTPSVAISRNRAPAAASSCRSRSAMSLFAYRNRCALDSRTPSMIEAWLRASEMTASSSPSRVSKSPPLASKHDPYRMVSSVPRKSLNAASSRRWTVVGAADEPHRRHAVAVLGNRRPGLLDQRRMVGQPQVVVGAQVDHLGAVVQGDHGILAAGDRPLRLVEPVLVELLGLVGQVVEETSRHGTSGARRHGTSGAEGMAPPAPSLWASTAAGGRSGTAAGYTPAL